MFSFSRLGWSSGFVLGLMISAVYGNSVIMPSFCDHPEIRADL